MALRWHGFPRRAGRSTRPELVAPGPADSSLIPWVGDANTSMTERTHIFRWLMAVSLVTALLAAGFAEASALRRVKGEMAATDFALKDLDGKSIRLSDFKGKAVLLNFWATWCQTCVGERPALERLYRTYRSRGFVILAVSIDRSRPETVKAFVKESRMSFPVLHDPDDRVSPDYWVQGIPTSVLVTPKGAVAYRVVGQYDWDGPEMRQVIEGLLPRVVR